MQLFIIGSLLDSLQAQIKVDLEQSIPKSSKVTEMLINEALLSKLESMPSYSNMVMSGTFPRDFSANVADRKSVFRRYVIINNLEFLFINCILDLKVRCLLSSQFAS